MLWMSKNWLKKQKYP